MNDFKNYKPPEDNNNVDPQNTAQLASYIAKAMNGTSEGQLWRTILAEAEKGKREGRLTNADLDNFYNTISPMVNGFKRKKLKEIIDRLKKI